MPESARIAEQLKRAFEGDAWHGPAVLEILAEVDARTAASHPISGAHSIWELALHVAAWDGVVRRRLAGETVTLSDEENFPKVEDKSEASWKRVVDLLKQRNEDLQAAVSRMPDSRLSEIVPGKDYDFQFMLHGAVQHALYHAGQMAILKRA